jgi:DNA-binding XRE family transcriptional regulator
MNAHTNHTIIYDDGDPVFVVVPYEEYVAAFGDDGALIPHEVVKIQVGRDCSLMEAWRRYRKLTQEDMANRLGMSQPAYAKIEKSERPRHGTLEKVAAALEIDPAQIVD